MWNMPWCQMSGYALFNLASNRWSNGNPNMSRIFHICSVWSAEPRTERTSRAELGGRVDYLTCVPCGPCGPGGPLAPCRPWSTAGHIQSIDINRMDWMMEGVLKKREWYLWSRWTVGPRYPNVPRKTLQQQQDRDIHWETSLCKM